MFDRATAAAHGVPARPAPGREFPCPPNRTLSPAPFERRTDPIRLPPGPCRYFFRAGRLYPEGLVCFYGKAELRPKNAMFPPFCSSESAPAPKLPDHFYGFRDAVFEVTLHEPPASARAVPEALVHDLWRAQRFASEALTTSSGTAVEVLAPGVPNPDAGPDFLGARLRMGRIEWAGDVEIHVTSGAWFEHRHHLDARYNGVILHVTLFSDLWTGGLLRADGSVIPEITLFPHLDAPLHRLLHRFRTRAGGELPCEAAWPRVPAAVRRPWIERLAVERMEARRRALETRYLAAPDLEALLHERLFAALGYAKNAEPMADLARRLPLARMRRIDAPCDLEALHFGTAGLLPAPADLLDADRETADYVMDLRERFERLRHRFAPPPMERASWRFFRLRPANFPPLRIAQGTALLRSLLHHDPLGLLLAALDDPEPATALRRALHVRPSAFWERHVRLEKATRPRNPSLGASRVDVLLVNAVLPVLLFLADQRGDPALEARVFDVLRALPPEKDEVTRRFDALGAKAPGALYAQGLHQLYRTRCRNGRCLSCPIGRFLLGNGCE